MIQSYDIVLATMNPPKVPDENRADRAEEDAVRGHEVEETARAGQDLPGNHDPSDDGAEELSAANVDIGWEKRGEVVGRRETIGRDIDAQGREGKGKAGEESAGAVGPEADERGGVPFQRAVVGEAGRGGGDAAKGDEGEDDGQHGDVQPLPLDAGAAVAGEIRHVDREGSVVADDGGKGREPGVGIGGPAYGGFVSGGEESAAGAAG